MEIKPQPGYQTNFLSCEADIVIGGGAAGAGKTYSLLLESLRNIENPKFGAEIFRRTVPQITATGGLWDESQTLYPLLGANPNESKHYWTFKSGARVSFSHMQHEKNKLDWQGSQIPLIGFDELSHFCLTPDTDVLTNKGWKNITELNKNDKVASLDKNENIEYKDVIELYSFNYNGKLKSINQRNGVSFRATPNHKAVVMKQLPNSKKEKGKSRMNGWKFKSVKELKGCYIPRSGKFKGRKAKDIVLDIPKGRGHGNNSNNVKIIKIEVWLSFLGWYFSEGCSYEMNNRTKSPVVSIRQTKKENYKELIDLFNNLGYRWCLTSDGQFRINSRQLFNILKPFGNSHQKRIPKWIFNASKKQQKIFWDSFVKGDGSIGKTGVTSIGLCNEKLIDDLQIIAFHIGLVATKGYSKTKTGFDVWRITASKCSNYNFVKKTQWYEENYNGKIYCPEVKDNNNFLIRHNGRICWTGNSKSMFLYMLSRNRSMCGVKPYIRATCNPDPDSFIAEMIDWAIDEDGYIKPEMNNKIRYFSVYEDSFIWGDKKIEVIEKSPHLETHDPDSKNMVKSFAFIEGDIHENRKLLEKDPEYLANLHALSEEEKLRLLKKNWKVRIDKSIIVDYTMFENMFSNTFVPHGKKYITCDIATEGKDCLIIWVFSGRRIIDIDIIDKNDGKEALERIWAMKEKHNVLNTDISFDALGVGGGLTGFIKKAREYKSINKPIGINNYRNLKSQCAWEFANSVNQAKQKESKHLYYMEPEVANKIYPFKSPSIYTGKTIKWILTHQLKILRRKNPDGDNKLELINKEAMKEILGGISPDFIESLIQREIFDLRPLRMRVRTT